MNHFYMFDITTYIPFLFFSNTLSSGIVQDNIIMCLRVWLIGLLLRLVLLLLVLLLLLSSFYLKTVPMPRHCTYRRVDVAVASFRISLRIVLILFFLPSPPSSLSLSLSHDHKINTQWYIIVSHIPSTLLTVSTDIFPRHHPCHGGYFCGYHHYKLAGTTLCCCCFCCRCHHHRHHHLLSSFSKLLLLLLLLRCYHRCRLLLLSSIALLVASMKHHVFVVVALKRCWHNDAKFGLF